MANSGAPRPNSASSFFPFERWPPYSEASSWPGYARYGWRREKSGPARFGTPEPCQPCSLGGSRFTQNAGSFMRNVPFDGPQQVLRYLANYTHRVALSNRRIVAVDELYQSVTFTYRDYRHGSQLKELTLSALEFIRRFSLHILPSGLVRIRHYGILGSNRRKRDIQAAARSSSVADTPWSFRPKAMRTNRCVVPPAEKPGICLLAFTDTAGLLHLIGVGPNAMRLLMNSPCGTHQHRSRHSCVPTKLSLDALGLSGSSRPRRRSGSPSSRVILVARAKRTHLSLLGAPYNLFLKATPAATNPSRKLSSPPSAPLFQASKVLFRYLEPPQS